MTRDQLLADLLLERYSARPSARSGWGSYGVLHPLGVWDDSDIATRRRRRELDTAVKSFDVEHREVS